MTNTLKLQLNIILKNLLKQTDAVHLLHNTKQHFQFSVERRQGTMKGKRNLMFLAMAVCLMGLGLPGTALAVDAFAECAYTKNDVACYVYANTGADDLISAGVKLTDDANDLALAGTTKNDADWYFGDGTTTILMSPEEVADGVIYIVGKLDTNAPQAGVNGPRLLIGRIL